MAVSEADVVREALDLIGRRFTEDAYQKTRDGDMNRPGPNAVAFCAVGGVEQAIWKLTGKDVSDDRDEAKVAHPRRRTLYANVMRRLNAKARELFPDLRWNGPVKTVEEVTFLGSHRTARQRTLSIFRAVLADLQAK